MMQYPTDEWVRKAAADPQVNNLAAQVLVASGVFAAIVDAVHTADDLLPVIDALRQERRYVHSDRLRALHDRLVASANHLTWLTLHPQRELLAAKQARHGVAPW